MSFRNAAFLSEYLVYKIFKFTDIQRHCFGIMDPPHCINITMLVWMNYCQDIIHIRAHALCYHDNMIFSCRHVVQFVITTH